MNLWVSINEARKTMSAVAERVRIHWGFLAILFLARNDSEMPITVLEKFRDNLKDFIQEVDKAIDRSRKNNGSGPKN